MVGELKWRSALPATRTHSSCVAFPLFRDWRVMFTQSSDSCGLRASIVIYTHTLPTSQYRSTQHSLHPCYPTRSLPYPSPLNSQQHSSGANARYRRCPATPLCFPHQHAAHRQRSTPRSLQQAHLTSQKHSPPSRLSPSAQPPHLPITQHPPHPPHPTVTPTSPPHLPKTHQPPCTSQHQPSPYQRPSPPSSTAPGRTLRP